MAGADRLPVLIVGAGPAGLIAAIELARRGVAFRIIDRREGPVSHSNAALLHVRTLELLDGMGLADLTGPRSYPLEYVALHAFGRNLGGIRLNAGDGLGIALAGLDNPYPTPRILPQRVTEGVLIDYLADTFGIEVERQRRLVSLKETPDQVDLVLNDADGEPERLSADWVIGSDGDQGQMRAFLGIPFAAEALDGFDFIHADLRLSWSLPSGRAYTFVTKDGLLALFPFNATGSYRLLLARHSVDDAAKLSLPDAAALQDLLRAEIDPDADILGTQWIARSLPSHGLAERLSQGRVFLIGDAGHTHFPVGGQGMNAGMQDAINLGWKLAGVVQGRMPIEVLASYDAERYPVAQDILKTTDRAFHLMVQPGDLGSFALKLFGSTVIALDGVQDRLRRVLGEAPIQYLTSPLSEDHGGSIGPIAGARAADAIAVLAGERRTLRLLHAMKGVGWNLLLFAGSEATTADPELLNLAQAVQAEFGHSVRCTLITPGRTPETWAGPTLLDREGLLHQRYGVLGPVLYLIRPDWHIGCRAPLTKSEALLTYLRRWFKPA